MLFYHAEKNVIALKHYINIYIHSAVSCCRSAWMSCHIHGQNRFSVQALRVLLQSMFFIYLPFLILIYIYLLVFFNFVSGGSACFVIFIHLRFLVVFFFFSGKDKIQSIVILFVLLPVINKFMQPDVFNPSFQLPKKQLSEILQSPLICKKQSPVDA